MCNRFPIHVHSVIHTGNIHALRQLHSDFGDYSNGVCRVSRITRAESNPDMGLLTQHFALSPDVVAGANKMPIMRMSVASDQAYKCTAILSSQKGCRHTE